MIKLLKEDHEFIFIDSLLFDLNVTPYTPGQKEDTQPEKLFKVLTYLQGLATANNLELKVDGVNLFLRGGDFPSPAIHDIGFIDPITAEQFTELNWDVLKFGGTYFFEVPKAHQNYLEQVSQIPSFPYELQFNIVTYNNNLQDSVGVDVGTFISANIDFFDLVHNGSFKAFVSGLNNSNSGGISFNSTYRKLKSSLSLTQTTSLMGQIGHKSLISIGDSIPYESSEISSDGQRIRSQVEFVEAGFGISVDSRSSKQGFVFDFTIENSSADFAQTINGLPVIRKRLINTRKILKVNEVLEIARIETNKETKDRRGLTFLKNFLQRNQSFEKSNISIFVKRLQ